MTRPWEEQTLLERMATAVERVRERLRRATSALDAAGVPYAVVGGHAVAAWIATIDPAAVRNTQDVDILFRDADLDAAERVLTSAGFAPRNDAAPDRFADLVHPDRRNRVLAKIGEDADVADACSIRSADGGFTFRVPLLDALLALSLRSFKLNDQVDVRDMLDVGLIDASWKAELPPDLADRLQHLIDTPEG